ncbi:MAG: hypothetical protein ACR2PK_05470 [Acidimicrobiales bacterium]
MTEVATKKLLENDKVIVWELILEPGEETGVHTHELDYIVHVVEGATLLATDGNGENEAEVTVATDDTYYFAVNGDVASAGGLETTATHNATNLGPGRYKEIMVEVK